MAEKKLTTLLEIIKYSANLLNERGIKDSRLNVELMFCDILKCDRMKLYLDFDKPLKPEEIAVFKAMLKRRMLKEPLQYILGKTNFYGYEIILNNKVLIPRQETEILVDKVLENIYLLQSDNINILEIGSGSGCIAIAISAELSKKKVNHKIVSIDKSEDAVTLSNQNAKLNNISEENLEFKILDYLKYELPDKFDYVISNPPYIPAGNIKNLDEEVKSYEPIGALTDGGEGLIFYKKIFSDFFTKSQIILEIGDGQKEIIEAEILKNGIKDYNFYKDYCNIERVLLIN
jgi:release factor glutamine methyltransferase